MIFNALDKIRRGAILTMILLFTLGIVLLLIPLEYVPTLIIVLGYALLIFSMILALNFISCNKSLIEFLKFVFGLAVGVVGVFVLVFRDNTLVILTWLAGLGMIFYGLFTLVHSLTFARRARRKAWWVLTVLAVVTVALGVVMFINPWFVETNMRMKVIAIAVLFMALVSGLRLVLEWPIKLEDKEVKEDVKES